MGFGFVVARFGLFLRELQITQHSPVQSSRFSLWIGVTLLLIGVGVNVSATLRQARLIRELKSGEWDVKHQSRIGVAIALLLASVGAAMAIYLVVIR